MIRFLLPPFLSSKPPLPSPLFLLSVVYHPVLIYSHSPSIFVFFFLYRGCIRRRTGRFYERGVYVSMWVFVTLHLNPHHSFVCFFGLFIVRTLPFSCSAFLQRPSVPTPDYPPTVQGMEAHEDWRCHKSFEQSSNETERILHGPFGPWRWDHYVPSKRRVPVTQSRGTTHQKNGVLKCTAAKA